jgi:hypothetical protein
MIDGGRRAHADARARFAEVARHYRWNVAAHLAYGIPGTTGWRLIMAPTLVPAAFPAAALVVILRGFRPARMVADEPSGTETR